MNIWKITKLQGSLRESAPFLKPKQIDDIAQRLFLSGSYEIIVQSAFEQMTDINHSHEYPMGELNTLEANSRFNELVSYSIEHIYEDLEVKVYVKTEIIDYMPFKANNVKYLVIQRKILSGLEEALRILHNPAVHMLTLRVRTGNDKYAVFQVFKNGVFLEVREVRGSDGKVSVFINNRETVEKRYAPFYISGVHFNYNYYDYKSIISKLQQKYDVKIYNKLG